MLKYGKLPGAGQG